MLSFGIHQNSKDTIVQISMSSGTCVQYCDVGKESYSYNERDNKIDVSSKGEIVVA